MPPLPGPRRCRSGQRPGRGPGVRRGHSVRPVLRLRRHAGVADGRLPDPAVPQPVAHAAYAERNKAMGSLDNSNAYYNHLREPEFFERYDTTSRRSVEENAARRAPPVSLGRPFRPPAHRRADSSPRPLVDFFDRSRSARLAARDAPTDGDLREKQAVSSRAAQEVLVESKEKGGARIATVTAARSKLLDYGRPALAMLRKRTDPRGLRDFPLVPPEPVRLVGAWPASPPPATKPPTAPAGSNPPAAPRR